MDNTGANSSGNKRFNDGSSSKRRGRKSSSSKKPKQPQRGLGVAQLEKIRIESMGGIYLPPPPAPSNPSPCQEHMRMQEAYYAVVPPPYFGYNYQGHQNIMMGMGQLGNENIGYGYSQPSAAASWIPSNNMLENQQYVHSIGIPNPLQQNITAGNATYANSQPIAAQSWIPGNGMLENQQYVRPVMTRNFMNLQVEAAQKKPKTEGSDSTGGSNSQNSETSGAQEIDLTLRLA